NGKVAISTAAALHRIKPVIVVSISRMTGDQFAPRTVVPRESGMNELWQATPGENGLVLLPHKVFAHAPRDAMVVTAPSHQRGAGVNRRVATSDAVVLANGRSRLARVHCARAAFPIFRQGP